MMTDRELIAALRVSADEDDSGPRCVLQEEAADRLEELVWMREGLEK